MHLPLEFRILFKQGKKKKKLFIYHGILTKNLTYQLIYILTVIEKHFFNEDAETLLIVSCKEIQQNFSLDLSSLIFNNSPTICLYDLDQLYKVVEPKVLSEKNFL